MKTTLNFWTKEIVCYYNTIISRRELMSLGIEVSTSTADNTCMSGTTKTNVVITTHESFHANPRAGRIDPSRIEKVKLHDKPTEELPTKDKIRISLENGSEFVMPSTRTVPSFLGARC